MRRAGRKRVPRCRCLPTALAAAPSKCLRPRQKLDRSNSMLAASSVPRSRRPVANEAAIDGIGQPGQADQSGSLPSNATAPPPTESASALLPHAHAPGMTHDSTIPVQQPTHSRQCDLGVLGHFAASTIEDWHVVGLEVLLPDSHWPGYERSKDSTPCRIVGFIDPFPWPPSQSQSNAAAYVVETE